MNRVISKYVLKHMVSVVLVCLFVIIASGISRATEFAWIEDAGEFERGELRLGVGGAFYSGASFPFSGLEGKLYEVPWIGARFSASENAQFYFNGAVRKYIRVEGIDSAFGSVGLESPVELNQSRSATGDFSIYSKLRIPLFENQVDLGLVTGFTMPNTNTRSGLGLDENVIHGRAILGYTLGDVRLIGNIGIAIIDNATAAGQDDFFTYGFASVVSPAKGIELHGEIYGVDGPPDGDGDGLFDSLNVAIGAGVIGEKYSVDFTVKNFLKDPSPSSGFFVRFGRVFHLGRR